MSFTNLPKTVNTNYFQLLQNLIGMTPTSDFTSSRIRTSMYTFSASAKLTKQFGFDDSRFRELVRRNINRAQYQSELASYCKKLI